MMPLFSCMSQIISSCLPSSLLCFDYEVLACHNHNSSSTTASISSCSFLTNSSKNMVHLRGHRFQKMPTTPARSSSTGSKNQLVKAVSPFDELLSCRKTSWYQDPHQQPCGVHVNDDDDDDLVVGSFPFDEIVIPKVTRCQESVCRPTTFVWEEDKHPTIVQAREPEAVSTRRGGRRGGSGREGHLAAARHDEEEPREDIGTDPRSGVPTTVIAIPKTLDGGEAESEISCESGVDSRTLTPYPSFDSKTRGGGGTTMTANDLYYLVQATRKLEQMQDWPSDEDVPPLSVECEWVEEFDQKNSNLIRKNGMAMMILKDLDETLSGRGKIVMMTQGEI